MACFLCSPFDGGPTSGPYVTIPIIESEHQPWFMKPTLMHHLMKHWDVLKNLPAQLIV